MDYWGVPSFIVTKIKACVSLHLQKLMIMLNGEQDHTYAIVKYLLWITFAVSYSLKTSLIAVKNVKYFEKDVILAKDNEKGSSFSCHFIPSFMGCVPYIKAGSSKNIKHH